MDLYPTGMKRLIQERDEWRNLYRRTLINTVEFMDECDQAAAVCRYLRGEVKKMTDDVAWLPHYQEATARWQVESKRWENECHDLRGEVERLGKANALLVCENMKLDAELDEVHAELEEHEIQLGKELSTHE